MTGISPAQSDVSFLQHRLLEYVLIRLSVTVVQPGLDIFPNFTVVNDNLESDGAANPTAIDLGNDRLLVAYEGTLGNETRPICKLSVIS
jgi:hypothetical protein